MDVILIGAGGHGRVVLDIIRAGEIHNPIGFLDADPQLAGQSINGVPVLGQINLLLKLKTQKVKGAIIAIGDNQARRSYAQKLAAQGFELLNAVHPASHISPTAKLGRNVVVAAGAVVCTDARVGDSVIINTAAVIDHECEIGTAAHICPAAALAGRVSVGEECFIGLGCRIIQCLRIGDRAVVGAGAVLIQDVAEDTTVVGVPGRVIKAGRTAIMEPAVY
jgi:UDP-perosamine 4-acetyltransferase